MALIIQIALGIVLAIVLICLLFFAFVSFCSLYRRMADNSVISFIATETKELFLFLFKIFLWLLIASLALGTLAYMVDHFG